MKKTKIILYVIVIILLITTAYVFNDTYALFENDASGVVNSTIGRWIIKLSNQTITSGLEEEIVINNFVYSSSSSVASGVIAPGGHGYFDLIFDATDCDVAVKYDIEFRVDEITYEDNISINVQAIDSGATVRTDVNTYSGIISLASISNDDVATIRVNLNWDDDGNHDDTDTALGIVEGNHLEIPITVHAVQYLGETLTPYVEPTPEPEPEPTPEP